VVAAAVQFRPLGKPLFFQQFGGAFHRILLQVKGNHPALFPHQTAKQSGIAPTAHGSIDAQAPLGHMPGYKIVSHTKGVDAHFPPLLPVQSFVKRIAENKDSFKGMW
jgi:hypothetical protein